jgi:hypothetical protein
MNGSQASPLSILNGVLRTTEGKDRLLRFLQYLSKFLGRMLPLAAGWKARQLELVILNGRKLFRLLRFLENFSHIRALLANTSHPYASPLLKVLQVLQQASLASFFLVDHTLFFSNNALLPFDSNILKRFFGGTWCAANVAGLAANVMRLHHLNRALSSPKLGLVSGSKSAFSPTVRSPTSSSSAAASPLPASSPFSVDSTARSNSTFSSPLPNSFPDISTPRRLLSTPSSAAAAVQMLRAAQVEACLDGLRSMLDIPVAANLALGGVYNNGVMGALGMVTSSLQLYQLYCSHTTSVPLGQRLAPPALLPLLNQLEKDRGDKED